MRRWWLSVGQQHARLYAYGANRAHGKPPTNADKRKAVLGMLADAPDWSDRAIAKHVGVSPSTVGSCRPSLSNLDSETPDERAYTTKHGTEAVMKTSAIGKASAQNVSGKQAAAKARAKGASQATTGSGEVESDSTQEPSEPVQVAPEVKSDFTPATDPNIERIAELEQMAANLHRRQLSAGQQAAIVASAQDWANAQTVGKPQLRNVAQLETAKDRAAQSGASHRTQQMADKVAKADPALSRQVALVGSLTVFRTQ